MPVRRPLARSMGSQPPKITLAWRSIAATVSRVVSSGPRPAGIRTQAVVGELEFGGNRCLEVDASCIRSSAAAGVGAFSTGRMTSHWIFTGHCLAMYPPWRGTLETS